MSSDWLTLDSEVLAGEAARGSRGAFHALLVRHQPTVERFVRWYATAEPDPEDALQEIFLEVYRSLGSFRARSAFSTWLYAIARNVCRRRLARAGRRAAEGPLDEGALELPDGDGLEKALLGEEARRVVREAIEDLAEHHKLVLLLREWEGLSYEEISELLEIPVGTVRSRLHHAAAGLAKAVQKRLGGVQDVA